MSGHVLRWQRYCKSCSVEYSRRYRRSLPPSKREAKLAARRARHAERMESDPEYRERHLSKCREGGARWVAENPEKAREVNRRSSARRRERDPGGVNEESRMYYALRQERAGKPVQRSQTVIDGTLPRVSAEPFRKYLVAYSAATGISSYRGLGNALGIEPKRVELVWGGQPKVALDVVDRALQSARIVVRVDGHDVVRTNDLYKI